MPVTVTKENFEELVLRADKPVLLDFWAQWCGPCKQIAPVVEQIARERADILVGKVDVDTQSELAVRFRVVSIPTLLVLKAGQVTQRAVGYRGKAEIEDMLSK